MEPTLNIEQLIFQEDGSCLIRLNKEQFVLLTRPVLAQLMEMTAGVYMVQDQVPEWWSPVAKATVEEREVETELGHRVKPILLSQADYSIDSLVEFGLD